MKQVKAWWWIPLVGLSIGAYFFRYASIPRGYFTDVPSNLLNAMCLAARGVDEYGTRWPWAIRAFDDWRPPLLIYLLAALRAFRLESARLVAMSLGLLGTCLIWAHARFSRELPRLASEAPYAIGFCFLILSSWVMVIHRMPVEFVTVLATVTPLFVLSWRLIERPERVDLGIATGVFLGLTLFAYYGTKPLFFTQALLLVVFTLKGARHLSRGAHPTKGAWHLLGLFVALGIAGVMAIPTLWDLVGARLGMARFKVVGTTGPLDAAWSFARHVDLRLFFISGDRNFRHHTQFLGVLNPAFLIPYLVGLVAAVRARSRYWWYVLAFFVCGFLPATAAPQNAPHAIRTLCVLPALVTICVLGYSRIERFRPLVVVLLLTGVYCAARNVREYQVKMPRRDQTYWTLTPPYVLPTARVSTKNHRPETINERYYRVLGGDDIYCGAN